MENDWQGVPPTRTSIARSFSVNLSDNPTNDPRLGTSGQWWFSTALQCPSISEKNAGSHPSSSHATDAASMPEHTLPYLTSISPHGKCQDHCATLSQNLPLAKHSELVLGALLDELDVIGRDFD